MTIKPKKKKSTKKSLKKVASASLKKRAKRPKQKAQTKMLNTTVVSEYVEKLNSSLGNDDDFMTVFNQLTKDRNVSQLEAAAIGSAFVAPMASTVARGKALERILKRHKNLVSFKLKQKAVGGRSAA